MSTEDDPKDAPNPRDFGVLRRPGDPTHDSISTTQTNSGLAAGDPAGGPHRTPERRDLDESRGRQPQPKSGRDPDLRPRETDRVRTPEDVDATPPHGDELLDR
jgi:hypothetical protein